MSIDEGNTWITIAEREPVHYSSTPKRESKSDSAGTLLATLRKNGRATHVVKSGMGKRLGHDGKTMELMNLVPKQKTLEMKSPKERNYDGYIRYLYFDNMDLGKIAPALEEYRKSNAYKQNRHDFCTKPYGVFKITSPIVVMKCRKKDYDEFVVDVEHPVTLKRGWLVDIDTLYGIRDVHESLPSYTPVGFVVY